MALCATCGSANPETAGFCRQCGGELPHTDPLLGQDVLGRYRIVRLVGEGGMGRVYEAEQRVGTTTRRVAVKTLRPQLSADPQVAKRFFREAETIVRLSHPNLIQFFDFGEVHNGILALVMEFIEGNSLAQELERGPLEPSRVDRILAQICGALAEAHGLGIVHRDLKPDNVLLTRRGGQDDFVKVLDFGIAKISAAEDDRSTKLTQQGMMVGTPPYMSPEQFSGDTVDARSDVYSLGVIAYEMLTSRLPFDARTPWEWASKHLTAEPAPLRVATGAAVSERRGNAIRRALAKRPEHRPQQVHEFLAEFVEAGSAALLPITGQNPLPPAPQPQPEAPPTGPHATRAQGTPPEAESIQLAGLSRPAWVLPAVALGAVLCVGAGALWLFGESDKATGASSAAETGGAPLPPALPEPSSPQGAAVDARPAAPLPVGAHTPRQPARAAARAPRERDRERQRPSEPSVQPAPERSAPAVTARPTAAPIPTPAPLSPPRPSGIGSTGQIPGAVPAAARVPANQPGTPSSDPAAADLQARVDRAIALAPQRVEVALGLYQAAAARYGAEQPALKPLRSALAQHGEEHIRQLLSAGRCAQAQAFQRALTASGAGTTARRHFGSTCAAP